MSFCDGSPWRLKNYCMWSIQVEVLEEWWYEAFGYQGRYCNCKLFKNKWPETNNNYYCCYHDTMLFFVCMAYWCCWHIDFWWENTWFDFMGWLISKTFTQLCRTISIACNIISCRDTFVWDYAYQIWDCDNLYKERIINI